MLANITVATGTTDLSSSNINKGAIAAVSDKNLNLGSIPQTLTFRDPNNNVTKTETIQMISLDSKGLTMLAFSGGTGYYDNQAGTKLTPFSFSVPFKSLVGWVVTGGYFGNTVAYTGYTTVTNGGGELYVTKADSSRQERMIRMVIIGYL